MYYLSAESTDVIISELNDVMAHPQQCGITAGSFALEPSTFIGTSAKDARVIGGNLPTCLTQMNVRIQSLRAAVALGVSGGFVSADDLCYGTATVTGTIRQR